MDTFQQKMAVHTAIAFITNNRYAFPIRTLTVLFKRLNTLHHVSKPRTLLRRMLQKNLSIWKQGLKQKRTSKVATSSSLKSQKQSRICFPLRLKSAMSVRKLNQWRDG